MLTTRRNWIWHAVLLSCSPSLSPLCLSLYFSLAEIVDAAVLFWKGWFTEVQLPDPGNTESWYSPSKEELLLHYAAHKLLFLFVSCRHWLPIPQKKLLSLTVDQKGYKDALPLRRASVHVNTSVCLVCIFKCLCNEDGMLVKWSWSLLCSGCWDGIGEQLYSVLLALDFNICTLTPT